MNRQFAILAAVAVTLSGTSWGAPQAPTPRTQVPATLSPEVIQEIQETVREVEKFKIASRSFHRTVNGIVKRAYKKRRKGMLDKYGKQILIEEEEERVRRIAAITLFEDFLRRYPNDKRWSPDVLFRLAELYFEKSNDEYLMATERFEEQRDKFDRGEIAEIPTPPKQDYSQTIDLHRRLIREFPRYRLVDGAYYLLGFCLSEMGDLDRGNESFLALVCSNNHRPPLTDAPIAPDAAPDAPPSVSPDGRKLITAAGLLDKPRFNTAAYDGCKPLLPKSRFNPEAWVRIGEFHFDENQLGEAIAAYHKVVEFGAKDNAYYDEALYKLAWTYYRADKFTEAITYFDTLVIFSDKEYAKTGKYGSEMRPESIQYLGISFAEEDWDGDTLPDSETGFQRIENFYGKRTAEKHVYEVYNRLANIYFNTTKYEDAVKVYKLMLKRWPYRAENPDIQDKVILALERERKFDTAIKEREEFTRLFGKGTAWESHNKDNPKALKKARNFDEQALIQSAVYHHKMGQDLKARGVAMSDGNLLQQAAQEYALAALAYAKYLDRFPDTKNSYEIRYSYASCLYYSQRFLKAGEVFAKVRDSHLDDRYKEDSAFSATKAYEEYISIQIKDGKLPSPELPKADKAPASLTALAVPDAYQKWQAALDAYTKAVPASAKTPRLTYKAAEISYRFLQFDDARKRFTAIYQDYCKDPVAITAGQAVLVTYQLEKNLDKMEEWATNLKAGKCGGGGKLANTTAAGAAALIAGIKFKRAQDLMNAKKWDEAAAAFLAIVDADPKSSDADKALNNAAVCYEKSKRFESATKIYERLWKNYQQSPLAGEALWRTAVNYQRFFEYGKAVNNFLILADSPRFTNSSHRTDSVYNAANILENDQAYARSAKLFLRYADTVGKAKEAAEAYYRAGLIYEKMKDYGAMVKIFRSFSRLHGSAPGQAPAAVEGIFKIAKGADDRNDWNTARKYYRATIKEYNARGQQPASDAAEYSANAAFMLAERKLVDFLKTRIKGKVNTLQRQETRMGNSAKNLKLEYDRILNYKRARWMLAAMFRSGTIFEHFARSVAEGYRNAPIPRKVKRLGQEAVDIYMGQLDELLVQQVTPLEDRAKKLYEECVKKAREIGVSNKYTEDALVRLNAFDAVNFPLLKKPKVEMVIE